MSTQNAGSVTLVIGGVRSGKSKFAEDLILSSGLKAYYLATGRAFDDEMQERISIHQERRGAEWETIEEPLALADTISNSSFNDSAILVDCITIWVTNLMLAKADVLRECELLISVLNETKIPIIIVTSEVGKGIMPDNEMAREYGDLLGLVNQRLVTAASEVFQITAGLPMKLKG